MSMPLSLSLYVSLALLFSLSLSFFSLSLALFSLFICVSLSFSFSLCFLSMSISLFLSLCLSLSLSHFLCDKYSATVTIEFVAKLNLILNYQHFNTQWRSLESSSSWVRSYCTLPACLHSSFCWWKRQNLPTSYESPINSGIFTVQVYILLDRQVYLLDMYIYCASVV